MIYTIREAAAYCNRSVATMRYHIYRTGYLMPDYKKGQTLLFEQVTLDMFKAQPRKSGPKPKEAKS